MLLISLLACLAVSVRSADLYSRAKQHQQWITQVRRTLHQIPELGFQEHKTSEHLQQWLKELDIDFKYPVATTGIVATVGKGKPVVALRTDIDALPVTEPDGLEFKSQHEGRMHACGHDAHMSMLLGAAKLLKEDEAALNGTVKLIFQPGEEGWAGAKTMLDEGALDDVDGIFGFHNMPTLSLGTIGGNHATLMAGTSTFDVVFHGRGGHAAIPHGNVDPILPAAHFVTAVQTVASREISPLDSIVVSVTILEAGKAHNVIPDTARVKGTLRALNVDTFNFGVGRVEQIAASVGHTFRCNVTVDWQGTPIYPPTINEPVAWSFAKQVGQELFGNEHVRDVEPMMAGEDFAFYLQKIPGAFIFLGHFTEELQNSAALHNPHFKLHEDVLPRGAAYHAALATRFLQQGGFPDAECQNKKAQ